MTVARGVVAAGHPVSARAGADVLRAGGNAVDAALGAMLAALTCEPLLTGLGAGGYMLVAREGMAPVLLDFFVEAPGREDDPARPDRAPAALIGIDVSFGDAVQVFHVGPASVGTYGFPAGVSEAAALFAPGGRLLRAGERLRQPELGDALDRLGAEGAAPFYAGDIGSAIAAWLGERGGLVGSADLAAYAVVAREPLRVRYRGREVLTNPPPSPGGLLLARALALLDAAPSPPPATALADVMEEVQALRTPAFLEGLGQPGFAQRFLRGGSRLGSTTHVSVLDAGGGACSVTCSNGSTSGVIVPGTGVHLNNMLGESDLNPQGFHRHPPGLRMPSMMSPTILLAGEPAGPVLAVGSAGSNRIRSAVLQTIVRTVDEGLDAQAAIEAPRLHYEGGVVYAEPGIDVAALRAAGRTVQPFRAPNLFFGGAQATARGPGGEVSGGGDPRRGGAAVLV